MGSGESLVLIAPETAPDHSDPLNWRPSAEVSSSPGASDRVAFEPGDDLLEYALHNPNAQPVISIENEIGRTVASFSQPLGHDDAAVSLHFSPDLQTLGAGACREPPLA